MNFKNLLCVVLCTISFSSQAKDMQCTFNWDIKSYGVVIGTFIDNLISSNESTTIESKFTVRSIFSLTGLSTIDRIFFIDKKIGKLTRLESRKGSVNEDTYWSLVDRKMVKKINNVEIESFSYLYNDTIDSTVFPYLHLIGYFDTPRSKNVPVLSRSGPRMAEVTLENSNPKKISFESADKHGSVSLNSDKSPESFEFSEGNNTIKANLKNKVCI